MKREADSGRGCLNARRDSHPISAVPRASSATSTPRAIRGMSGHRTRHEVETWPVSVYRSGLYRRYIALAPSSLANSNSKLVDIFSRIAGA